MKFFAYLLLFSLSIALLGLFVLKKPNGQPWLSVDNLNSNSVLIEQELSAITSQIKAIYKGFTAENTSEVKVYRWKDAEGTWHYSDKSSAAKKSEEIILNSEDILVLPAYKPSKNPTKPSLIKGNEDITSHPSTTSPNKVTELFKDASNVQKLMDERQQKLSEQIEKESG